MKTLSNKNYPVRQRLLNRSALGAAISVALMAGISSNAQAFEFGSGDWRASLDTTITYGVSMRMSDRDSDQVGKANLNPLIGGLSNANQRLAPGRWSVNSDDGNLKYDDGDLFSNAAKVTSEFSFSHADTWGGFLRASYLYDFENANRKDLSLAARKKVGEDFRILDAFLFYNFNVGDNGGTVRLGQQVVSWGESTFITNGINVINGADLSKLRVAGAELKEAFLPVNMLWGSFSFTENFSAEALYMFEFEQVEVDPAGTYFSTNDFASPGAEFVMLNFGTVDEPANFGVCRTTPAADPRCGVAVPRGPDHDVKDSGQYGMALRYFAPALHDTEFGFYFLNYHSRLPLLSGTSIRTTSPASARYNVEYPEDIKLYGLSFNTTLADTGWAWQGEVSYRENMPLQFDDVELLFAALSPLNALTPNPYQRFISQLGTFGLGQRIQGWERHEVSQWQTTLTKVFGNVMGADQIAVVAEIGGTKVMDFPDPSVIRYQGDGTDTGGGPDINTGAFRNPITQVDGFPDAYSWGYRVAARADYNSAFGSPINLSPRIAFNHDVNGTTPGPGGNFVEGRKSVTLGVEAVYLNQWSADLSYTSFSGAGNLNLISDRDFASFTIKYSF